jgi:hypothetical protein
MLVALSQALFVQKGERGERGEWAELLQEAYGALVEVWGKEAKKVDAHKMWKEF